MSEDIQQPPPPPPLGYSAVEAKGGLVWLLNNSRRRGCVAIPYAPEHARAMAEELWDAAATAEAAREEAVRQHERDRLARVGALPATGDAP